jgi:Zn-dependent M32 family carboxypeptidase
MSEEQIKPESNTEAFLGRIARDMQAMRSMLTEVVNYMKDAESEVPEKMRRFIMYMHDVHDVMNMYTELGQVVPPYIHREAERCDDRYRHLLEEGHLDGGWIERVRREMSKQPGNRWDHGRLLPKSGATK